MIWNVAVLCSASRTKWDEPKEGQSHEAGRCMGMNAGKNENTNTEEDVEVSQENRAWMEHSDQFETSMQSPYSFRPNINHR